MFEIVGFLGKIILVLAVLKILFGKREKKNEER